MEYMPRESRARDRQNPARRNSKLTRHNADCLSLITLLLNCVSIPALALLGSQPLYAQQCTLIAGAPACANPVDPGSLDTQQASPHHVGNPIDVITGNKYQREDDYRAIGSHLNFSRHYNSALVDHDVSLGPGWRHSYHVVLTRIDEDHLQIVQSDGRRIVFRINSDNSQSADASELQSSGTKAETRGMGGSASGRLSAGTLDEQLSNAAITQYLASRRGDGYLLLGQNTRWVIPDGRQMQFYGSFLTAIDYPDNTSLQLHYSRQRLDSVTDHLGQTLSLRYTPGDIGLGQYDAKQHSPRPGHLETLTLPDGTSIQYGYDGRSNLTRAKNTDSDFQVFDYHDLTSPSHMTGRTEGDDHRLWQYDDYGRGTYYSRGDKPAALSIEYLSDDEHADSGTTRVERGDGVIRHYNWRSSDSPAQVRLESVSEQACAGCKAVVFNYARERSEKAESLVSGYPVDRIDDPDWDPGSSAAGAAGAAGAQNVDALTAVSATDNIIEFASNTGQIFLVEANRRGKVTNVTFDGLSLQELLAQADNNGVINCNPDDTNAVPLTHLFPVEPGAADQQGPICLEQLLKLIDVADQAEQSATSPNWQSRAGNRQGYLDFCSLPAGRTCAELQYDLEMAVLSQCAYHTGPCDSDWQPVTPQSIGLTDEDFIKGAFAGRLFRHPVSGEYVFAFRGSDEPRDFFEDAIQFNEEATSQYRHAIRLSDRLDAILGTDISYTGHSLGGGLATTAALRNDRNAIVFNSAALTEGTADQLEISTQNATTLIDNVVVEGEFVTRQQDIPRIPSEIRLQNIGERIDGPVQMVSKPAPGSRVTIPRPYHAWLQQDEQNQTALVRWVTSFQLHLMTSVLESLNTLLEEACGIPR